MAPQNCLPVPEYSKDSHLCLTLVSQAGLSLGGDHHFIPAQNAVEGVSLFQTTTGLVCI